MRTNIEIDDRLMEKAQRLSRLQTKRAVVEAGLRMLVRVKEQEEILRLPGTVRWEGDLDQSRRGATTRARRRSGRPAAARLPRGTNAKLVEDVLQANAPRALRPAEIRSAIQRDRGVALAFTSLRQALRQLQTRRVAEYSDDGKAWRWGAR